MMFLSDHNEKIEHHYYVRREHVFLVLTGIFLGSLTMLNILSLTKMIQFEFIGFNVEFPIGVLPYPITFLCTDFISEIYGEKRANAIVWVGLMLNAWVLLIIYIGDILPPNDISLPGEGHYVFDQMKGLTYAATVASMAAYLTAQFIDVKIFHMIKHLTKGKHLWLRNNVSTLVSQLVDSFVVTMVVYYTSDAYAGKGHMLINIIFSIYFIKLIVAILDTIPFYLGVNFLNKYLHINSKNNF
jgi:uncharacterized integral membrane protein (TIGR00697 family)